MQSFDERRQKNPNRVTFRLKSEKTEGAATLLGFSGTDLEKPIYIVSRVLPLFCFTLLSLLKTGDFCLLT